MTEWTDSEAEDNSDSEQVNTELFFFNLANMLQWNCNLLNFILKIGIEEKKEKQETSQNTAI